MAKKMSVWHGSDKNPEELQEGFVGTGKALTGYAWGKYFFSSQQVAKWYRNILEEDRPDFLIGNHHIPKTTVEDVKTRNQRFVEYMTAFYLEYDGYESAKKRIQSDLAIFNNKPGKKDEQSIKAYEQILLLLDEWRHQPVQRQNGGLYEVKLAPEEEQYLDWQQPLKDQTPYIHTALRVAKVEITSATGKELYNNLRNSIASARDVENHPITQKLAELGYELAQCTPSQIASQYLNAIGIPGIRFLNVDKAIGDAETTGYILFDDKNVSLSTQIKRRPPLLYSALERTLHRELPARGTAESYLTIVNNLKESAKLNVEELNWYGVDTWLKALAAQPGGEAFDIERNDVLNYVRYNRLEVKPVEKDILADKKENTFFQEVAKRMIQTFEKEDALTTEISESIDRWRADSPGFARMKLEKYLTEALLEVNNKLPRDILVQIQDRVEADLANRVTRESEYRALEGGDNYRELLITMPDFRKPNPDPEWLQTTRKIDSQLEKLELLTQIQKEFQDLASGPDKNIPIRETDKHWVLDIPESHTYWIDFVKSSIQVDKDLTLSQAQVEFKNLLLNDDARLKLASEINEVEKNIGLLKAERRSALELYVNIPEWEEDNVLAHIRFDERNEPDGKTLFIHEIRSSLHELGSQKGYRVKKYDDIVAEKFNLYHEKFKEIQQLINEGRLPSSIGVVTAEKLHPGSRFEHIVYKAVCQGRELGGCGSEQEAYQKIAQDYAKNHPNVIVLANEVHNAALQAPDAPFKKSWPLLCMKHVLDFAVKNKFDKVAWPSGQMVAEMLEETTHIREVQYDPDTENLMIWSKKGHLMNESNVDPKSFSDYIGSELSEKLLEKVADFQQHREQYTTGYDEEESAYLIYDAHGDVVHDMGGTLLNFNDAKDAEEEIIEITRADDARGNIPSLKGLDYVLYNSSYQTFYDNVIPAQVGDYIRPLGGGITDMAFTSEGQKYATKGIVINDQLRQSLAQGQSMFRRIPRPVKGLSREEVEAAIQSVAKSIGIPVTVVEKPQHLPWHLVRDLAKANASQDTAGVYDGKTGKAYLIAANIVSPKEAIKTYIHEAKGHAAFRAAAGSEFNTILDQIYRDMSPETAHRLYAVNKSQIDAMENQVDQQRFLAEEWVAEIAETNPKNNVVQKISSILMNFLRKLSPDIKWTSQDIVQLLEKGEKMLRHNPYILLDGPKFTFNSGQATGAQTYVPASQEKQPGGDLDLSTVESWKGGRHVTTEQPATQRMGM